MGYALLNNHLIACKENDLPTVQIERERAGALSHIFGDELGEEVLWWPTLDAAERHMRLFAHNDFQRLVVRVVGYFPTQEADGQKLGWARIPQALFDKFVRAHQRKWGKYAMRSFKYWRIPMEWHESNTPLFHDAALADAKANKLLASDIWPETA